MIDIYTVCCWLGLSKIKSTKEINVKVIKKISN